MAQVEVYSKTTGEKHIIPEHWLESDDPRINNFQKTPPQKTAAAKTEKKES